METHSIPQPQVTPHFAIDQRRILVVDDNVDSADMLFSMLELSGHKVEKSYTGGGALESADRFRPEVVFLDIGLPDMDGYEVAGKLRELPGMDGLVIVALTGYGREKDRDRALAAGFNLHLVKPVTLRTLLLTISGKDHL
jgi:CheY-like chemotaxis protein